MYSTLANGVRKRMIDLQNVALIRVSLSTMERVIKQFLEHQSLIILMVGLQLAWLALILVTGTSTDRTKILELAVYSTVVGLLVIALPERSVSKLRGLKDWLLRKETRTYVALCVIVVIVGVFYAYSQRVWGDEERVYRVTNIISSQGVGAGYQESGWLRNKHPFLMPLVYSLVADLFGINLFYLRLVSVIFLGGTLMVTYLLARELYDRNTAFLAAFFLLFFPLVIRLGASAMMDIELTFFFSLALLLSVRLLRGPSYSLACLIGMVIGLGLLTKYTMVLVYGVLLLCIIFLPKFRHLKKYFVVAAFVSLSMFAVWLFFANQMGILSAQIEKIRDYTGIYQVIKGLEENIQPSALDAPASGTESHTALMQSGIIRLGLESLLTRIPSSLGVHLSPLIVFAGIYLLRRRKWADLFVLFWIAVVFITLLLTLPDHRYFLPAFPAIAILIARMFHRFPVHTERAFLLSLLFWAANMYLFVDWVREAHLILLNP